MHSTPGPSRDPIPTPSRVPSSLPQLGPRGSLAGKERSRHQGDQVPWYRRHKGVQGVSYAPRKHTRSRAGLQQGEGENTSRALLAPRASWSTPAA